MAARPTERARRVGAWAIAGGFVPGKGDGPLVLAIAVALAETGGDFNAGRERSMDRDLPHQGCASWGAWAINSCPDRDGSGPPRFGSSPAQLLDPLTNARSAYAISGGGTSWSPWTTFRKGRHRPFLAEARKVWPWLLTDAGIDYSRRLTGKAALEWAAHPVNPLDAAKDPLGTAADLLGAATDPLDLLGEFLHSATSWEFWRAVLFVIVGLVLIVGAIALVAADQGLRNPLARARTGGAPTPPED